MSSSKFEIETYVNNRWGRFCVVPPLIPECNAKVRRRIEASFPVKAPRQFNTRRLCKECECFQRDIGQVSCQNSPQTSNKRLHPDGCEQQYHRLARCPEGWWCLLQFINRKLMTSTSWISTTKRHGALPTGDGLSARPPSFMGETSTSETRREKMPCFLQFHKNSIFTAKLLSDLAQIWHVCQFTQVALTAGNSSENC